jgi:uncharacterized protein (DUF1697 family)
MTRYVALLRGINVGGKNLIPMPALKAAFESQGFADVVTYIQSGNVVFSAPDKGAALVPRIEAGLSKAFDYAASVVVRSRQQLRRVVHEAPPAFGTRPAQYRYDVLYLKPPLTAAQALALVPVRAGVERVFAGSGVLYVSRLIANVSQSQLNRLVAMPIYRQMTIRNWNTTTRLLEILDAR